MAEKEKRKVRGYKCTDKVYKKAIGRAKREKTHLSNIVESIVTAYGNGFNIGFESDELELVKS